MLLSLPDLPLLKSIRLDYWSLCGDGDNRGCVKEKCPSVFLNQLIMKGVPLVDLPSLTHLDAKDGCFQDIGIISLESMGVYVL